MNRYEEDEWTTLVLSWSRPVLCVFQCLRTLGTEDGHNDVVTRRQRSRDFKYLGLVSMRSGPG